MQTQDDHCNTRRLVFQPCGTLCRFVSGLDVLPFLIYGSNVQNEMTSWTHKVMEHEVKFKVTQDMVEFWGGGEGGKGERGGSRQHNTTQHNTTQHSYTSTPFLQDLTFTMRDVGGDELSR
jgi:hypothetical protein